MNSNHINRYKEKLKFTKRQRSIMIGKLLGDAHLESLHKGRTFRLVIEHSITQKKYVDWLYNEFREWVRMPPKVKEREVNGKIYKKYYFRTLGHASFRFYHHQFYDGKKKIVPRLIYKWLSPIAFAVWFMDDGSIKSKLHRARIINTQGFTKNEVSKLIEVLWKNFEIRAQLRKQKEGYQIYLLAETISRFVSIVLPYMLPSMMYKLKGLD